MAISKIISESLDLTDDYAFTGTITGAGESNDNYFYTRLTSSQSIAHNTATEVVFQQSLIDENSRYNTSTGRFTPVDTGKYFIFTSILFEAIDNDTKSYNIEIYKNGASQNANGLVQANGFSGYDYNQLDAFAILDITSSTDYISAYVRHNYGTNRNIVANYSWFGGYKIKS